MKTFAIRFSSAQRGMIIQEKGLTVFTTCAKVNCAVQFSERKDFVILTAPQDDAAVYTIVFYEARVALYKDGSLTDEDWPLGDPVFSPSKGNTYQIIEDISALTTTENSSEDITDIKNFLPSGENCRMGDCMPFSDGNGEYHLFYLFDRRGHRSKYGLGAHQWDHISTTDLITWKRHPRAVSIDEQYEGSICTGSVIKNKNKWYCFYAVRMSNGSPAQIGCSVSYDGEIFQKTEMNFTLSSRYDGPSARDPKVFCDSHGVFHMLVTTSLVINAERPGALAHLTCTDLEHWQEENDPFLLIETTEQPECTDYFYFNGWFYLLVSLYGFARLYRSQNELGPWEQFEGNTILPGNLRVPKVAFLNNRLIAAAFDPIESGTYAGRLALAEAIPGSDGNLTWKRIL